MSCKCVEIECSVRQHGAHARVVRASRKRGGGEGGVRVERLGMGTYERQPGGVFVAAL